MSSVYPAHISSIPRIEVDHISETLVRIYFDPIRINPTNELYEQPMQDLHLRSAGVISIDLDNLTNGWISLCRNPARASGGNYTLDDAVEDVIDVLERIAATGIRQ